MRWRRAGWVGLLVPCQACEPGAPAAADTATDTATDTSGASTRLANSAPGWHACPDGPWTSVQVGYEIACGVHEGGCVECWGSESWEASVGSIFDEPDIDAVQISLRAGRSDGQFEAHRPFACALDIAGVLTCWGVPLLDSGLSPAVESAGQVAVGESFIAVLDREGTLSLFPESGETREVEGVSGELCAATYEACAAQGDDLQCWDAGNWGGVTAIGPVAEWSQYASDHGSLVGVRSDGSVAWVDLPGGSAVEVSPPDSPWISVRGWPPVDGFVTNSEGYTYNLNDLDAGPVLPEPSVMIDDSGRGICGVTIDGRMQCERDFEEVYPPPGEFIVRL